MKYEANTGDVPKLQDHVEICNLNGDDLEGQTGRLSGWADQFSTIAIVILDTPVARFVYDPDLHPHVRDLVTAITMPVVCLRRSTNYENVMISIEDIEAMKDESRR